MRRYTTPALIALVAASSILAVVQNSQALAIFSMSGGFLAPVLVSLALIVAAIALGGWLYLRTPATPLASVSSLDHLLGRGEPVVLEFFGNT